ncbi:MULTISPECIES: hypothetical protein [unclassified Cupriavidus]|uniref:hypothetical protein n=1 Tax=unclassified Cupriavidus TaxID=2640874 RepID=UPI0010F5334F|nr:MULTISPECIES: hypothetical protein [unclassified Cupriavidus]MWL88197.1 hypothetical protein [Cupriavidus sp. SW-Y-13]
MQVSKKLIAVLVTTAVGAAIGAALGYGPLIKYKSVGVIHVEMTTGEYKRIAELASDAETLREFASVVPPKDVTGYDREKLVRSVVTSDWQTPVPKISKIDSRELPDLIIQMEQERSRQRQRQRDNPDQEQEDKIVVPTSYLGVRLAALGPTPTEAAAIANWLGSYFKDIATREAVRDQVYRWSAQSQEFSERAAERALQFEFAIEQAKVRAAALKRVVAEYPEAARREGSQVVQLRRENEKFISPLAQLVGAESEIIDYQAKLKALDREQQQQAFFRTMLSDVQSSIASAASGADSVVKLSAVLAAHAKNAKTDAEREKAAALSADISHIVARFQSQAQFLAKPSIPGRPEMPTPPLVSFAFAVLFGLVGAAFFWRREVVRFISSGSFRKD